MPSKVNFEESIRKLCLKFSELKDCYEVIINDETKLRTFVKIFKQHGMDFAIRNSSEKRKKPDRRLLWQYKSIKTFNTPFSVKNVIVKECVFGSVRKKNKIRPCQESVNRRFRSQNTKKMGCKGTMKIVEVVCYPQYAVSENMSNIRKEKAEKLKNLCTRLQQHQDTVLTEQTYYITVSKGSVHSHSVWSSVGGINVPSTDSVGSAKQVGSSASVEETSFVPLTEAIDSTENWVQIQKIRELTKRLHDSSSLIACCPNSDFSLLYNKLLDVQNVMSHFTMTELNNKIALEC